MLLSNFSPGTELVCAARSRRTLLTPTDLSVRIFISAGPDVASVTAATLRRADGVAALSPVHLTLPPSSSSWSTSISCHQRAPPPLTAACHMDVTVAVTIPMEPRQDGYGEIERKTTPPSLSTPSPPPALHITHNSAGLQLSHSVACFGFADTESEDENMMMNKYVSDRTCSRQI